MKTGTKVTWKANGFEYEGYVLLEIPSGHNITWRGVHRWVDSLPASESHHMRVAVNCLKSKGNGFSISDKDRYLVECGDRVYFPNPRNLHVAGK